MKTIEREHFEAWLFSQPPEREFDYMDIHGGCAVCSFIRETTNWHNACGGSDESGVWKEIDTVNERVNLPNWIKKGEGGVLSAGTTTLTIANMRRRYLELFPETEIEVKQEAQAAAKESPAMPLP